MEEGENMGGESTTNRPVEEVVVGVEVNEWRIPLGC